MDSRKWIRRHREQIASAQTTRSQKAQHSTATPHNVQVGGGRASSVDVIGRLVVGLLGPGLLQRDPGRVFSSQQPDETAVGRGHRRRR